MRKGAIFPKSGTSPYTVGTLTNRGKMVVDNSVLKIGGDFIQEDAASSSLVVTGTGDISNISNIYQIHGGTVNVGPAAKFMNLNPARNGFLTGTTIEVRSTYVRTEDVIGALPEVIPATVTFSGTTITGIGPGVDLTVFGSAASFPTAALASNAGRLAIGGDHGIDNAGSVVVPDFTNTGRIEVCGSSSELRSGSFTQNGAPAVTTISTGSKLRHPVHDFRPAI